MVDRKVERVNGSGVSSFVLFKFFRIGELQESIFSPFFPLEHVILLYF